MPACSKHGSAAQSLLPAANAECHQSGPDDFRRLMLAWRGIWPEYFAQK
jgi:hypothetical protein